MPVIGLTLKSLEASRTGNLDGELTINSIPTITNVSEINIAPLKKNALNIAFDFVCEYKNDKKKDVAKISMSGDVIYATEDVDAAVKRWKEEKKLEGDVSIATVNAILRKCFGRSIQIADELQLPPPLRFPMIRKGKKGEERKVA